MNETMTKRDKAWNAALSRVLDGHELTVDELAERADVSDRTAGAVLRVMTEAGWLRKDGGEGPVPATWAAGERLPRTLATMTGETTRGNPREGRR